MVSIPDLRDRPPPSRPSHAANQFPIVFTEVVPGKNKGYKHHFFAFTPECMRLRDGHPCQDGQFGVTNLSGKPGFLPNDGIGDSNLSKQIIKCIGSVVSECEYNSSPNMVARLWVLANVPKCITSGCAACG